MVPIIYERVQDYNKAIDLVQSEQPNLSRLCKKTIKNIWVVWDMKEDKWFSDCPVLIDVGDTILLVNNYESNSVDIGWDAVIIDNTIHKIEHGYDFNLRWINDYNIVSKFRGALIEDIFCEEHLYRHRILVNMSNPELEGETIEHWEFSGIGFKTSCGYISVFNGIDQNAFSFEYYSDSEDYRYTKCSLT